MPIQDPRFIMDNVLWKNEKPSVDIMLILPDYKTKIYKQLGLDVRQSKCRNFNEGWPSHLPFCIGEMYLSHPCAKVRSHQFSIGGISFPSGLNGALENSLVKLIPIQKKQKKKPKKKNS